MEVNVDLIANGQSQGDVAGQLQNNGRLDIGRMRPFMAQDKNGVWGAYMSVYRGGNPLAKESYSVVPINTNAGTLRRDEWKQLDDAVMEVSRQRLTGFDYIIGKGLTFNLGNAMGTTVMEWHDISDAMEASLTMDGVTRSLGDRPVYQHNYLPIPIIHVDYEINARALAASRNMGNPLDTTSAERAARKIQEKKERMLFTDLTYGFGEMDSRGRNKIYSLVNHPDRLTSALGTHWNDLDFDSAGGAAGFKILNDVMKAKQLSIDNLHYGPWTLFIPTNYETVIDKDYDVSTPGTTIRERIMKIAGIQDIKVIDVLAVDNILLVQMTSDVVRIVRGMGMQNIEWGAEGNLITKYKVMTIEVPQIRSDQNGKTGIVHLA